MGWWRGGSGDGGERGWGADVEGDGSGFCGKKGVGDNGGGIRIDGDLIPRAIDELPILAVLAAAAHGETVIAGAEELRVKESDRIKTTCALLNAAGVTVSEEEDGLRIAGGSPLEAFSFHAAGDHRLAMAAAIAALTADGPCEVLGAEACAVSYPSFFEDLARLTGSGP